MCSNFLVASGFCVLENLLVLTRVFTGFMSTCFKVLHSPVFGEGWLAEIEMR